MARSNLGASIADRLGKPCFGGSGIGDGLVSAILAVGFSLRLSRWRSRKVGLNDLGAGPQAMART